ncbi:MAG: ABC transporter ATP-binding protein [Clostridia bacterium]|nr:ABC transporter ATP-binding protein [Clostridia bacterium]
MMNFERPKSTKKTMARVLAYLGSSKYLVIVVLLLMGVSTCASLAGTWFLKPLINDYILPGNFRGLGTALLVLAGIYLAGVAASFIQSQLMMRVAQRTVNVMRKDLFDRMQSLPLRFFDANSHGELMSRFTNDMDNVMMAMEQSLTQLTSSIVTFVGTIAMMLVLSPLLFCVTAVMLTVMTLASRVLTKKGRAYFREQQRTLGQMNGYIEETIEGIKVVKAFTHESVAREDFQQLSGDFRKAATRANIIAGVIMPVMGNLNNISYAATAAFGGLLAIRTAFDIGSLAAFLQYTRHVGMPVNQITNQINTLLSAMAGAERIFALMDQEPETDGGSWRLVRESGTAGGQGGSESWAWERADADGSAERVPLRGDVRLHDVTFSYDGRTDVLRNVNLYAKPGQKIAFVGSTGAGKTTISNLLNRFYDVQQGQVTYDGIDVKEIDKADLRSALGMVLQDTHLFSGTVMENIRYGRLDATDEECVQAAVQASADSFIRRLPQGYDTRITGDGGNLSQGQRQLLAIARAYVADPPVMILDEATSSIDTRTERLIEQGMNKLMQDRTVFVIAHRLSTVRNANAILVLENGEIIERGDHDDLVAQDGKYNKLYTGQYRLT